MQVLTHDMGNALCLLQMQVRNLEQARADDQRFQDVMVDVRAQLKLLNQVLAKIVHLEDEA